MRRRSWLAVPFVLLAMAPARVLAEHTREDAMHLVQRAVAFLGSHPRNVALAAFNDPHGAFRDGELYLYVLDAGSSALVMLAHGANPALVGLAQRDMVDADGKDFNAESLALTAADGSGWVSYKWPNPVTRKIASKVSFVQRVGDLLIGAGIYE